MTAATELKKGRSLKEIFWNLVDSFTNEKGGFSARKLSGWAGVTVAAWLSHNYTNAENLYLILPMWLIFAALCLAIVTVEQVIRFREGKTTEITHTESLEIKQTTNDNS